MAKLGTLTRAIGVITSGTIAADETITVAGKVYTFVAAPSAAGDVDLGADDDESLDNLAKAINLSGTAGTEYDTDMVVNEHVTAVSVGDGATVNVIAKMPGVVGGFIPIAESTTGATVDATLGAGTAGAGNPSTAIAVILDTMQLNSEVIAALDKLDASASAGV